MFVCFNNGIAGGVAHMLGLSGSFSKGVIISTPRDHSLDYLFGGYTKQAAGVSDNWLQLVLDAGSFFTF